MPAKLRLYLSPFGAMLFYFKNTLFTTDAYAAAMMPSFDDDVSFRHNFELTAYESAADTLMMGRKPLAG